MKPKLVILGPKNLENQEIFKSLAKLNQSFIVIPHSESLTDYPWQKMDLLVVDFSDKQRLLTWPDQSQCLPSDLVCLGLFEGDQEAAALHLLEQDLIHDYLLREEASELRWRKILHLIRRFIYTPHTLKQSLEKCVQERTKDLHDSNQKLHQEIKIRKQAERQAKHSQERLLAITRAMPDHSLILDAQGTILAAYASQEDLLYRPLAQIINQNIFDILPDTFHAELRDAIQVVLASGQEYTYEYLMPVPAGMRCFEVRATRVESFEDEDQHVILVIRDITSRKEYQQALSESEQKFRAIFDQTIQLMGILDTEGRILDINKVALSMVGINKEQIQGLFFWDSPWWQHSQELQEQVKEAIELAALGAFFRFEVTHKDPMGQTHFVDFSISPLRDPNGEVKYLIPTGHNITSLKQALEALETSETQFSMAFEYAPIGKALISRQGRFFRVNRIFCEFFGYSPDELAGLKFKDLTDPDEVPEDIGYLRKLISHEIDIYTREKRYRHKNGQIIWGKLSLVCIPDAEGHPLFLIAQVENITHQKKALAELKQSEERFKHLTASLEDIIYTIDADLVCTSIYGSWNPNFNTTPDQLIGVSMHEMPYEAIQQKHLPFHKKALKGEAISYEWAFPGLKTQLYYQTKLTPLKNERGEIKGVVGSIRDISNLKRAEYQIKSSLQEKELLLREIYHRVKNNLQIISSMLNLQTRQTSDEHTISLFTETQNRVISMALVHEKLYESSGLSELNFAHYIQDLCSHLVNVYALRRSEVHLNFDCEPIHLNADIAIPCGLILNEAVSNALKHAFPEYLNFSTPYEINISLQRFKVKYARISIQDNGIGLPNELCFENLESLGLRLIQRLSQQIDGELTIQRDKGTCIQVLFPLQANT